MNDLDVVERAQKIIGSGSITKREYKNPKWRPTYQLYVGKKSGIEPVLKAILPYMGERRAEAIKEQLAALEKITQRQ